MALDKLKGKTCNGQGLNKIKTENGVVGKYGPENLCSGSRMSDAMIKEIQKGRKFLVKW